MLRIAKCDHICKLFRRVYIASFNKAPYYVVLPYSFCFPQGMVPVIKGTPELRSLQRLCRIELHLLVGLHTEDMGWEEGKAERWFSQTTPRLMSCA